MRVRLKPWSAILLLAAAVAGIAFGIDAYRHRFVRTNVDTLRFLPQHDATVLFADVKLLRRSGMLALLEEGNGSEDREYAAFVRQTHFDYKRDLDALAAAVDGDQVLVVIRGRFNWDRLQEYAVHHGGTCGAGICKIAASATTRPVSFFPIQPDVLALAFSRSSSAVAVLKPPGRAFSESIPPEPVWMRVSKGTLKSPAALPVPLRIFAISMQPANRLIVSLSPAGENSGAAFNLRLDASCPSAATAETVRNQLQIQTKMLTLELAREHQHPNPADLTGLLTSGSFQVVENHVIGAWPVSKDLLKTLQ